MISFKWKKEDWKLEQFFIVGLLVIIAGLFSDELSGLFNSLVIEPVLSKYNRKGTYPLILPVYTALFIATACWGYQKLAKNVYKASVLTIAIPAGLCYLYWRERFFVNNYHMASLSDICYLKSVTIFDPAYLLLTIGTVCAFINKVKPSVYPANQTFLNMDQPIEDIGNDQYERQEFFQKLLVILRNIAFDTSKGFAIGINSSWGYGKSSLLKLIEKRLKQEENVICVQYNPWLSIKKQSLTHDFFQILEDELSKYIDTSNMIAKYGEQISKVDNDKNIFKNVSGLFVKEKSLQEQFEQISELIKRVNRKIYFIIDDLDRLDNLEVSEVLRLIRNTGNFPRITFIVAYDKNYIKNALTVNKLFDPERYLEKIFDLELVLPKIQHRIISEILLKTFVQGFDKIRLIDSEKKEYIKQLDRLIFNTSNKTIKTNLVSNEIPNICKNKRDIIKFVNAILVGLELNGPNIYLPDLFILEAIKLKDSDTYELIADSENFLEKYEDKGILRYKPQSQKIRSLFGNESITNLAKALFDIPETSDLKSDKAISIVNSFDSYFIYTVAKSSLSTTAIDNLLGHE
ncbi:P-loop NTPase fold protein [Chitinophaga pinensis]|uniref:AAA family ATPase n=1 Tax=Chitinophaga pinensis TaxID=79329 RepID=A0A5C6LQJ3_9BACT|nr:P-loop NTPase fold protein [Chitinophaga pinensis]TWV94700.1 AAA family ATPase [Chitinophaga pinensis]